MFALRYVHSPIASFGSGNLFSISAETEIDGNHQILGYLSQCRYAKDLYRASFEILADAGPYTVFLVGQRELFLSNSPRGTNMNTSTSTANPLILSWKRIRTQRAVPAGIITGKLLLERLSLSDEGDATGVVSTHTHKRNTSDSSFLSKLSDTSESMGGKGIDESVGIAVFHALCVPAEAEIERHTTPTNGYVVQYTMNPVSYYTETAFGDFRARSDGAARLYNWNSSTGYSRVRCDDREPLFLIEAKASQAALAEPQQFAQCLSFIGSRIERLKELGHTCNSMAGLPSWLWEAYIVCVDQMRWQLKSITFPRGYLGEVLGENKITGGLTLKHFKVQFRHRGAYQTYLVPDRIEIIKI